MCQDRSMIVLRKIHLDICVQDAPGVVRLIDERFGEGADLPDLARLDANELGRAD